MSIMEVMDGGATNSSIGYGVCRFCLHLNQEALTF